MVNINNYILEKLYIGKDFFSKKQFKPKDKNEFLIFCKKLCIQPDSQSSEKLYNYFKNDCNHVIGDAIDPNSDARIATDFELIFMLCAMLNDDNHTEYYLSNIGFKNYSGHNNPYHFSWFDSDDGTRDVLEIIQHLWDSKDNKFCSTFRDMWKLVNDACDDYKEAIDGIWDLQNVIEY